MLKEEDVRQWVINGPNPKSINDARRFGQQISKGRLTTSQIRQVFSKLKSIEAKGYVRQRSEFMMLKPFIAYAAGRQSNVQGLQDLKDRVTWGIDAVLDVKGANDNKQMEEERKRFHNFCKFFEAILAYHRASGGK